MSITIGCIGCGTMGGAVMAGLAERLPRHEYEFCGCTRTSARMAPLVAKGVRDTGDILQTAQAADVLLLGVKPYQVAEVLALARPALIAGKTLVSLAAGVSLSTLTRESGGVCPVVRCMPNTPALVGKGVFALCFDAAHGTAERRTVVTEIFTALGLCVELPEERFTAFSAWMGAGPAYVFEMMQGILQAGVTLGFQHAQAREMTTALFAGAALMAENVPTPLMQMRDEVCSPGGLTIAGVNHLDRAGLVGIVVDAVLAATARGREMEQ